MIVTLDTGILVRATVRSAGPAYRLVQELVRNPAHTLVLSPFIIGEVGKVLAYPRLSSSLGITPQEIHRHVAYLRGVCRLVDAEAGMPIVLNDPDDDPVVYTAIGGGASILCSRDRDFYAPNVIAFCRRYSVEVMDDLQLLQVLNA